MASKHLTVTHPISIIDNETCRSAYTYTPQIVQGLLDSLYTSGGDSEARLDLLAALKRLPDRHRALLILQAMGYTDSDIAKMFGVYPSTVMRWRPKAIWQLLREMNGGRL